MINTITTEQKDLQWLIASYHTAGRICNAQFLQAIAAIFAFENLPKHAVSSQLLIRL